MDAAPDRAGLVPVNENRGDSIKRRRLAHGIKSVREFAVRSGLSRDAITEAERGTASAGTYERLEAWLDHFEVETSSEAEEAAAEGMVTITMKGVYGVDEVTAQAPVGNVSELEEAMERLLRKLREG